eukprot:scaffold16068_cov113-Isochrysis_galbana.AAC.4
MEAGQCSRRKGVTCPRCVACICWKSSWETVLVRSSANRPSSSTLLHSESTLTEAVITSPVVSIVWKWKPFRRSRQACAGTSSHTADQPTSRSGGGGGGGTKPANAAAARGSPDSTAASCRLRSTREASERAQLASFAPRGERQYTGHPALLDLRHLSLGHAVNEQLVLEAHGGLAPRSLRGRHALREACRILGIKAELDARHLMWHRGQVSLNLECVVGRQRHHREELRLRVVRDYRAVTPARYSSRRRTVQVAAVQCLPHEPNPLRDGARVVLGVIKGCERERAIWLRPRHVDTVAHQQHVEILLAEMAPATLNNNLARHRPNLLLEGHVHLGLG